MAVLAVACAILAGVALALGIKLISTRRAARDILRELSEKLSEDTNTLISLSASDRDMRRLAAGLNRELRALRTQRLRYRQGDRELKDAVTNVSHDLRTPLTAICGYLALLEREDMSGDARRYLATIAERTEAMKALTEELFRYSVIASTDIDSTMEPVDMNAALEEAAAGFYAALTARGIEPAIRMPEQHVVRTLDRAGLSRIFANLFSNAIKYSAGDLAVELTVDGTVSFSNAAPDLDPVQVGRLFDRFFSLEAARDSTGLGLAIARTLAERMDGTVSAAYENGDLTVTVSFPATPTGVPGSAGDRGLCPRIGPGGAGPL